jgi:hypothetical protein
MADKVKQPDEETVVKTTAEVEPEYTVAELAQHSKAVFGVMPECVIAAFRVAGLEKATKQAAEKIINTFMKKEVK